MSAENYSAIASAISAACALFTLYMFRSQGKGFVWTKDHKLSLMANQEGSIHIQIEIPLFNFGNGNIKFIKLKAKKINLETKAMENFETDMDEAYFPEGASIISYHAAIHTFLEKDKLEKDQQFKLLLARDTQSLEASELKGYQEKINEKLNTVAEHIVILKCFYKDGSWFGKKTKETVIALSISGLSINFLSTTRRKELNEYFSW